MLQEICLLTDLMRGKLAWVCLFQCRHKPSGSVLLMHVHKVQDLHNSRIIH